MDKGFGKVMGKFPWPQHLGGKLDIFDTKELLYGPDPITHQDNLAYVFMVGIEPKYQGISLGSLLFQTLEAKNYVKGIDAAMGKLKNTRWFSTRIVWRYLASNGAYDVAPDGSRYTKRCSKKVLLENTSSYAPWENNN